MKKYLLGFLLIASVTLLWWIFLRRPRLLEVPFAKVRRETLVSTLSTNGKVEPIQWVGVYAQRGGVIEKLVIHPGQRAASGAAIAELDTREARADLAMAEARVREAQAELNVLVHGGRASELAQIECDLARANLDLQAAVREQAVLSRLVQQQAATKMELDEATAKVTEAKLAIEALHRRRATLVSEPDKAGAEAKLKAAQAVAVQAKQRLLQAIIRTPIAGTVYEIAVRQGSYVNAGDLIAKVGDTEKVHVRVYVDEPELGRVSLGDPVTITWDALPNKKWMGVVERMPTQVVPLGTRQVGEVFCLIENGVHELPPGANVNAEIRSAVVESALTIPREALRRGPAQDGVYVLQGTKVVWRDIRLGITSAVRAQVTAGLAEGDSVALPTEAPLTNGAQVRPFYPGQ
jgi:HlyD family secretion protein